MGESSDPKIVRSKWMSRHHLFPRPCVFSIGYQCIALSMRNICFSLSKLFCRGRRISSHASSCSFRLFCSLCFIFSSSLLCLFCSRRVRPSWNHGWVPGESADVRRAVQQNQPAENMLHFYEALITLQRPDLTTADSRTVFEWRHGRDAQQSFPGSAG